MAMGGEEQNRKGEAGSQEPLFDLVPDTFSTAERLLDKSVRLAQLRGRLGSSGRKRCQAEKGRQQPNRPGKRTIGS
jgi:hypothetical protein